MSRALQIEGLIRRRGTPVTVRRTVGTHDPVTSTRTVSQVLQVETRGILRRPTQRSMKGDPLSTQETYYLVQASSFHGMFVPKDSDLVIDKKRESRILAVRTREERGCAIAYELYVGGVELAVGAS